MKHNMNATAQKNVALTILQQLGGNKFIAMTGATALVSSEDALSMQLPRNTAKIKYLRIEITPFDCYNMIFRKKSADFTFPIVAEYKGVYAENLATIFTEVTGFEVSL